MPLDLENMTKSELKKLIKKQKKKDKKKKKQKKREKKQKKESVYESSTTQHYVKPIVQSPFYTNPSAINSKQPAPITQGYQVFGSGMDTRNNTVAMTGFNEKTNKLTSQVNELTSNVIEGKRLLSEAQKAGYAKAGVTRSATVKSRKEENELAMVEGRTLPFPKKIKEAPIRSKIKSGKKNQDNTIPLVDDKKESSTPLSEIEPMSIVIASEPDLKEDNIDVPMSEGDIPDDENTTEVEGNVVNNAPSVEVKEVPGGLFAVITFSGMADDAAASAKAAELKQLVAGDGLPVVAGGEWILARYNDPGTPPPFRKNEVLIPLDQEKFKLW